MRRRAFALFASLVALFAIAGPVAADWPGDPGTYKNFGVTHTECLDLDCNPMFNDRSVSASVNFDGSAQVCVVISPFGGMFEVGCTSVDPAVFDTHKGYIVGVPETTVQLHDGSLSGPATRTVTASAAAGITGAVVRENFDDTFPDGNCITRFSGKRSTVPVGGELTIDGTTEEVTTGQTSITVVQTRTRCPH